MILFKNDLRVTDNPALYLASRFVDGGGDDQKTNTVALFIHCREEWLTHRWAKCKMALAMRSIQEFKRKLEEEYKIPLIILKVEKVTDVPARILEFCTDIGAKSLFYNKQYERDEAERDSVMESLLNTNLKIKCFSFHDQCAVAPGQCLTQQAKPYTIFTPFKKCLLRILEETDKMFPKLTPEPLSNTEYLDLSIDDDDDAVNHNYSDDANLVSQNYKHKEEEIQQIAVNYLKNHVSSYATSRDYPELQNGTSGLSPYLALGMISVRLLLKIAMDHNRGSLSTGNQGLVTWVWELCWRDFYKHILVAFPHVMMNIPFKLETEDIEWSQDTEAFQKWATGRTGFPIVDAEMRQLLATEWMHNRLRMIVAMFLTKDLMINWRWGEDFFSTHLIDLDFASNNGGWQWSAFTGTDAQPYFRIFNPMLQSKKFDPKGKYIAKWIPELAPLLPPEAVKVGGLEAIHEPYSSNVDKSLHFVRKAYPPPMVDHSVARIKAIAEFKLIFSSNKIK